MTDLRALLTRAGEALEPFATLATEFKSTIRNSPSAIWLLDSADLERARALHAEITAALANATITIEQLDKLQFGRVLHERPAPDDGWRDIASAPEDSSEIEVKGQGWWSGNGFAVRPTHWRPRP